MTRKDIREQYDTIREQLAENDAEKRRIMGWQERLQKECKHPEMFSDAYKTRRDCPDCGYSEFLK